MGKKVATGMEDDEPHRRLIFSQEDVDKINKVPKTFLRNAKARCVLLVDKDGHRVTREGKIPSRDVDTISTLVAGSFAAVNRMAQLLNEEGFSILFHEGKKNNIQLSLVDDRTLLAVFFDDKSTHGMMRLYTSQMTSKLTEVFEEIRQRGRKGPDPFIGVSPP